MANRLSQVRIEVVLEPSSQKTRPSQSGREIVWGVVPGSVVSQVGVEVVAPVTAPSLANVISQVGVEVVGGTVPSASGLRQVTQTVAEAIFYLTSERARTTQAVLEVIW